MNYYSIKRGLVKGYDIGLNNDSWYAPVPDRDVISFKRYRGEIEASLPDGRRMRIKGWKSRICEESFKDKEGRGNYRIGYFLFREWTKDDELKELCL